MARTKKADRRKRLEVFIEKEMVGSGIKSCVELELVLQKVAASIPVIGWLAQLGLLNDEIEGSAAQIAGTLLYNCLCAEVGVELTERFTVLDLTRIIDEELLGRPSPALWNKTTAPSENSCWAAFYIIRSRRGDALLRFKELASR